MTLAGSSIFFDHAPPNFWLGAPRPFPRRQGHLSTLLAGASRALAVEGQG